jgi:hypothetical protein
MDGGTLIAERKPDAPKKHERLECSRSFLLKIAKIEQNRKKQFVCSYELTVNCEKIIDKKG